MLYLVLFLLLMSLLQKNYFVFNPFKIDANKSIQNHLLFWLAILVPIFLFGFFGYPVWKHLNWSLNHHFYSYLYKVSKLPLGCLAALIPLSLVVIRMHSSKQAAEQLNRNERQLGIIEKKVESDCFKTFLEFRSYIISELDMYQEKDRCLVKFNSTYIFNAVFRHIKPEKFNFDNINELDSNNYLFGHRKWAIEQAVNLKRSLEKSSGKDKKSNIIYNHQSNIKGYLSHWGIFIPEDIKIKYYFNTDEKLRPLKDEEQVPIFISEQKKHAYGNFNLLDVYLNIVDMLKDLAEICGVTLNELSKEEEEKINEINKFDYTEYDKIFNALITGE